MGRAARTGRACFVLGGALTALALPAVAEARPDAASVARTTDVPAGGKSVTLRCPRGGLAIGGAVIARSPEIATRGSVPAGVTGWKFRFAGGPGKARVVLRCVRVPPSGGLTTSRVRAATRTFRGTVEPGSSIPATLTCPSGFVPTGYGFEQNGSGSAVLAAARPGRRAWSFRIENEGNRDTRPTVFARCLARTAIGRGPRGSARHPLVVRRSAFSDTVRGGARNGVTHRCPAGHFSAAAGHSLDASDDVVATRAFTFSGRGGRWTFTNPGGSAETVRTYLTCLSLRTGYR